MSLGVWARGHTPAGPWKEGPGEIGTPISCGGQVVMPGDLICCDEDGVVVVPMEEAEAVIAARQKIVHGAVSMVEMALNELSAKKVVNLDEERKAAMVSNLLVVLCGEGEAHPVINTGTLYN
eukprot:gene21196-25968_t